jgi:membrane protein YdbS with pleckstrin-like domain
MSADPPQMPAAPVSPGGTGPDMPAAPPTGTGRSTVTAAPPAADEGAAARLPEEVELWWGAFCGWTLTPSFVLCLLLTGLLGWAAWYWVPHDWVKVTVLGGGSIIWLVQLGHWAARALGWNYRLTTRRLWVTRGIWQMAASALELSCVASVRVERSWLERRLGVGRVCVTPAGGGWPLVLEGVWHPHEAADVIRAAVQAARAADEGQSAG